LFASKLLALTRSASHRKRLVVAQIRSAVAGPPISVTFSKTPSVLWTASASSVCASSKRSTFDASSSRPDAASSAPTSATAASAASGDESTTSASVRSYSSEHADALTSLFSCATSDTIDVTPPSSASSGYSSGAAAHRPISRIASSRSTSDSANRAGSSKYLTRSCRFRVIFFSNARSSRFSDAASSSAISASSALARIDSTAAGSSPPLRARLAGGSAAAASRLTGSS